MSWDKIKRDWKEDWNSKLNLKKFKIKEQYNNIIILKKMKSIKSQKIKISKLNNVFQLKKAPEKFNMNL